MVTLYLIFIDLVSFLFPLTPTRGFAIVMHCCQKLCIHLPASDYLLPIK